MTIKQYTAAGLTGAATVIMFAATPAMACSHPTPKPVVHVQHKKDCDHKKVEVKKVVNHKDCDHQKDVKKVVEHKDVKKDCDHKVVQPKKVVEHKDCDHKVTKPGKGGGTPTPTPAPKQTPQVLSASTQPAPSTLPQTGTGLISLIGLPTLAAAGGGYLRYKLRK
jgi:LPXTG-motif cell wall-anchored protein